MKEWLRLLAMVCVIVFFGAILWLCLFFDKKRLGERLMGWK